jgi:uncharacterized protein YjbI with pentapeptide repeats
MPNRESDKDLPQSVGDEAAAAPATRRTIRLADIKAGGRVSATPAIKPVKVILALPSRPAPESEGIAPAPRSSPPSARPTARGPEHISTPAGTPQQAKISAPPARVVPTSTSVPHALPTPVSTSVPPASLAQAATSTSAGAPGPAAASSAIASKKAASTPARPVSSSQTQAHGASAGSVSPLTATTLPPAVGELFALNNYDVEYSKKIHGAEVDIVATPKGGAFGSTIYLEVTVQYVDNTKYGKDLTKFMLVRERDRNCVCISVSTTGFTADVRERAAPSGIILRTYDELFAQFEKFSTYVTGILESREISTLVQTYEEPYFRDEIGEHLAPAWLDEWARDSGVGKNWLVILGEYGTGKTALTLKLQHDWLQKYRGAPNSPIPIRIELRNFVRQFDARSLLHHFLDSNQLGHIPVDFLLHLIRSRRVILLLDGYDEMAQFLNARERRACLAALAELAGDGAKGILTSRPNYFTEAEELHVFDALYASLEQSGYFVGQMDRLFFAKEQSIDNLLERYLVNKNERYLRDLTADQTKSLVRRKLAGNLIGQQVVLSLLEKVFREETEGRRQSLGGKPVIISYLLELVEYLSGDTDDQKATSLSEWQIYKLIVDRLMLRDFQRSPTMHPDKRREALQRLAIQLSSKSAPGATEATFYAVVDDLFRTELRRLSTEEQRTRRDELFQDLRSSTTLTRSERSSPSVWQFSHNSLREFLVAEVVVGTMCSGRPIDLGFPISRAMRSFVAALPNESAEQYVQALEGFWAKRPFHGQGGYFAVAFDLLRTRSGGLRASLSRLMRTAEGRLELSDVALRDVEFLATELGPAIQFLCSGGTLTDVTFRGLDMTGSNFEGATFDRCSFVDCKLNSSNFRSAFLFECNFNKVEVEDCDFSLVDNDSNIVAANAEGEPIILSGRGAVGFFRYHGAKTDEIGSYYELQHHPRFPIVQKICERVSEQRNSQLRGLTQRGAAQVDPPFARDFMSCLVRAGLVEIGGNDLVSVTVEGRRDLPRLLGHEELPDAIETFLRERR